MEVIVISDRQGLRENFRMLNNLALIGQFGISLVVPTVLCVFICYFLVSRSITGSWVYIPGFILGIGSSFMTAYKFYLYVIEKGIRKDKSKDIRRKGIYFNRHF